MFEGLREAAGLLKALVCFVCLIGPALTISGIALLASSSFPERENKIAEYNQAVQEWDTLVTQFSDPQTDFAVNTANILQLKTGQPARLKDGDLSQISSYTKAARYETLSVTPVLGEITIDTGLLLPYTLSMPENQVAYERFYHQDYTGVPVDYTITKNEPGCVLNDECDSGSSCNRCLDDECFANGGSYDYDSRTCTIVRHLQSLCFVVENSTALSFEYKIEDLPSGEDLDGHVSSVQTYAEGSDEFYGCYYESENVIFGEPAFYPGTYGASPPNSIKFEIRHKRDPYVVASGLTRGTYEFGLSVQQKMALGFVFLGTGLALTAMVFCLTRWCFRKASGTDVKKPVTTTPAAIGIASAPMMSPQQPQQMMYGQPMQQPQQIMYAQPMQQPQQMMYAQPMQQPMMQQPQQMVFVQPMPQQQQQQLPPQFMQPQVPGGPPQYYPPQQMPMPDQGFSAGTKF